MNSSLPLISQKFQRIWANSGKFSKIKGNSVQFNGGMGIGGGGGSSCSGFGGVGFHLAFGGFGWFLALGLLLLIFLLSSFLFSFFFFLFSSWGIWGKMGIFGQRRVFRKIWDLGDLGWLRAIWRLQKVLRDSTFNFPRSLSFGTMLCR